MVVVVVELVVRVECMVVELAVVVMVVELLVVIW